MQNRLQNNFSKIVFVKIVLEIRSSMSLLQRNCHEWIFIILWFQVVSHFIPFLSSPCVCSSPRVFFVSTFHSLAFVPLFSLHPSTPLRPLFESDPPLHRERVTLDHALLALRKRAKERESDDVVRRDLLSYSRSGEMVSVRSEAMDIIPSSRQQSHSSGTLTLIRSQLYHLCNHSGQLRFDLVPSQDEPCVKLFGFR